MVLVYFVPGLSKSEALNILFAAGGLPEPVSVGHTRFKVDLFVQQPLQFDKYCCFGNVEVACLGADNAHAVRVKTIVTQVLQGNCATETEGNSMTNRPIFSLYTRSKKNSAFQERTSLTMHQQNQRYRP